MPQIEDTSVGVLYKQTDFDDGKRPSYRATRTGFYDDNTVDGNGGPVKVDSEVLGKTSTNKTVKRHAERIGRLIGAHQQIFLTPYQYQDSRSHNKQRCLEKTFGFYEKNLDKPVLARVKKAVSAFNLDKPKDEKDVNYSSLLLSCPTLETEKPSDLLDQKLSQQIKLSTLIANWAWYAEWRARQNDNKRGYGLNSAVTKKHDKDGRLILHCSPDDKNKTWPIAETIILKNKNGAWAVKLEPRHENVVQLNWYRVDDLLGINDTYFPARGTYLFLARDRTFQCEPRVALDNRTYISDKLFFYNADSQRYGVGGSDIYGTFTLGDEVPNKDGKIAAPTMPQNDPYIDTDSARIFGVHGQNLIPKYEISNQEPRSRKQAHNHITLHSRHIINGRDNRFAVGDREDGYSEYVEVGTAGKSESHRKQRTMVFGFHIDFGDIAQPFILGKIKSGIHKDTRDLWDNEYLTNAMIERLYDICTKFNDQNRSGCPAYKYTEQFVFDHHFECGDTTSSHVPISTTVHGNKKRSFPEGRTEVLNKYARESSRIMVPVDPHWFRILRLLPKPFYKSYYTWVHRSLYKYARHIEGREDHDIYEEGVKGVQTIEDNLRQNDRDIFESLTLRSPMETSAGSELIKYHRFLKNGFDWSQPINLRDIRIIQTDDVMNELVDRGMKSIKAENYMSRLDTIHHRTTLTNFYRLDQSRPTHQDWRNDDNMKFLRPPGELTTRGTRHKTERLQVAGPYGYIEPFEDIDTKIILHEEFLHTNKLSRGEKASILFQLYTALESCMGTYRTNHVHNEDKPLYNEHPEMAKVADEHRTTRRLPHVFTDYLGLENEGTPVNLDKYYEQMNKEDE